METGDIRGVAIEHSRRCDFLTQQRIPVHIYKIELRPTSTIERKYPQRMHAASRLRFHPLRTSCSSLIPIDDRGLSLGAPWGVIKQVKPKSEGLPSIRNACGVVKTTDTQASPRELSSPLPVTSFLWMEHVQQASRRPRLPLPTNQPPCHNHCE